MPTTMTAPQQQTRPLIPAPPRAITTKDLLYLKDAMSWMLIAFKKMNHYAQLTADPQIKETLNKVGRMHQRHYQKLLKHLQVDNNAVMANLPRPPQGQ